MNVGIYQKAIVLIAPLVLLGSLGALAGTALSTGQWQTAVSYTNSILTSDYILFLGGLLFVAGLWQLGHGGGYGFLKGAMGLLVIAFIGPSLFSDAASAIPAKVILMLYHISV